MKRLLLVGWDAADWKLINPLLSAGEMPHLARVISEGVRGNLGTIFPPLSPMVWTSIATGKRPHKHGIHGFIEPAPDGMSVRPITNLGRKTKAFWNILNQNGKRSIVAGWWPSHPAEPIRGAMLSNSFPFPHEAGPHAPLPPGAIWPPSLVKTTAELRVHATELTGEIIQMFVPGAAKVDQEKDHSLHDLAGIIAETMSIHAAATELMETQSWDLAAIYYAGIDHFSHRFMRYHAQKNAGAHSETDPELFRQVVSNAYRYHDVMLGRLIALAGPDAAVLVLSDHGFHSDQLLPDYIPAEAAVPAVEHRDFGIFCLRAPGVIPGEQVYGASVLDIAPTVLHLFGLPAARDMDGKVLISAFRDRTLAAAVPSWDEIPGDDGRHSPSLQYDGASSTESLKQLVALGYIAPLGDDARKTVDQCVAENRYNLARSLAGAGQADQAALVLRELIADDPEQGRFHEQLFHCHMMLRDLAGARRALDAFDRACAAFAPRAQADLARRRAGKPDEEVSADPKARDRKEEHERRELMEKASGFALPRLLLHCRLALSQTRTSARKSAARQLLDQVAESAGRRAGMALFLADGFASVGEDARALEFIRRARRADPENWQAIALEAGLHHRAKRYSKVVEAAVESLSLIYFQPHLHYVLGVSLGQLGLHEQAEQELRIAINQFPGMAAARAALGRLIRRDRARIGEAGLHLAEAQVLREKAGKRHARQTAATSAVPEPAPGLPGFERWHGAPPADRSRVVTIVTGLPRSGTSMMMQMLAAAGIEPVTDGKRVADSDNPRGYFEHEQATHVHQDVSWIPAARGKAVKIVAQLVPFLPAGEEYRVVFMHRNLEEVVASQKAMLQRLGRTGGKIQDAGLMRVYAAQLVRVQTWLKTRPEVQVLSVDYGDAVKSPSEIAACLAAFLGTPFDSAAAACAVDAALRRQTAAG